MSITHNAEIDVSKHRIEWSSVGVGAGDKARLRLCMLGVADELFDRLSRALIDDTPIRLLYPAEKLTLELTELERQGDGSIVLGGLQLDLTRRAA